MASDPTVGHLDDPAEDHEEEHTEQQRALGPERVDATERGDRDQRGAYPVTREPQCEAEREHGDGRTGDRAEHADAERPERRVERRVQQFREPRLCDPVRSRRGVRVDVLTRNPVIEDVVTGLEVDEERVVGQPFNADAEPEQREHRGEQEVEARRLPPAAGGFRSATQPAHRLRREVAPASRHSSKLALYVCLKAPESWIMAGPRMTTKIDGKMQNTRGKSIFTGAFWAWVWARIRRRIRISSA